MGKIYEALEFARKTNKESSDSQAVSFLSEEPEVQLADLTIFQQSSSAIAESFRFLRSKVIKPSTGVPPRSILVTSALTGEGKTFVAGNLAALICQGLDEYVLLIDADVRKPTLHFSFQLRSIREGLCTYLSSQVPLPPLIRKTSIDKLSLLPAGEYAENPAEIISSVKMKRLIQETRDRYPDRFVIIDSAPLELAPETSVLANEVDAVLLIVRYGHTPRDAAKAAIEKIPKEKLLGVVFNGCNQRVKMYGQYGHSKYKYKKSQFRTTQT
jgi:protein-tyrosine kinase